MIHLKTALKELEQLINVRANNNAGFVALYITDLFKQLPWLTLIDIENELREMGSRLYLIALPVKSYGTFEGKELSSADFRETETELPNALWVCMNGEKEAAETRNKNGLSMMDNRRALLSCGFLTIK